MVISESTVFCTNYFTLLVMLITKLTVEGDRNPTIPTLKNRDCELKRGWKVMFSVCSCFYRV